MANFYGIGVGPGDPELMTIKAVRLIRECDVIAFPGDNPKEALSYNIAISAVPELADKKTMGIPMPMVKNSEDLMAAHQMGADMIVTELDRGNDVAFLTLGDPCIYSTFTYLKSIVESKNHDVFTINGITSFLSAAALFNISLVTQGESLHIIPASYELENGKTLENVLLLDGTKVLMKVGKVLKEIKSRLTLDNKVWFIENCGLEGETFIEGVENIPDEAGYYSILIVK